MNNFTTPDATSSSKVPRHLETTITSAFQGLFPPINPQTTPLKSIQRVLLLNREKSEDAEDGSFVINFRHYAITTKPVGLSKPLRRLNAAEKLLRSKKGKKGDLPNLGKLQDISEFMIGGENGDGYMTDGTSGSEVETDAEVEILDSAPRKVMSSKARAAAAAAAAAAEDGDSDAEDNTNSHVERRAVKMVELGPRLRLRLQKVEDGICSGKVLWHEYLHKSKQEMVELERKWEKRRQEKEARKKVQKENVEKKRLAKESGKKSANNQGGKDEEEVDSDMDMADYDSDLYDEGFDSEGLAGDAEEQVNTKMEEDGDWESEQEEIAEANSKKSKKALR